MVDRETLERLLLDRSLGELSPDVERLLEEAIRDSSPTGDLEKSCEDQLDALRKALGAKRGQLAAALPPFPGGRVMAALAQSDRRGRVNPFRAGALRPLLMAAAIALAFFAGTKTVLPPGGGAIFEERMAEARFGPTEDAGAFWSLRRFMAEEGADRTRQGRKVHWTSPFSRPSLGDRS